MYQCIRGKPIKDIDFKVVRATEGKYRNKLVCDNIFMFDCETTSDFLDENGNPFLFDYDNPKKANDSRKHSLVWLWCFGIDDNRYIGRELTDFCDLLFELKQYINYHVTKFVYVHNLAFDFCFLQNVIKFDNVFARRSRHPMSAVSFFYGCEFKCSYVLSGLRLETWGESLNMPVKKKVGQLDYKAMRTPLTPLDDDMIDYQISDIDVMYFGLMKYREKYGAMWKIPLTHTGEMRLACQQEMKNQVYYCEKVTALMPQSLDEYNAQAHAFIGGTVLCNWLYKRRTLKNVRAFDIASSYPFVLVACKYPQSVFMEVPARQRKYYFNNPKYVYLIHFTAYGVESNYNCHFISRNKALSLENCVSDNGRVVCCDKIELILTSVDYEIFEKAYSVKRLDIHKMKVSTAGYLNDNFRRFIISLYKGKTTLKNVEGKEEEYQNMKALINAGYGDFVTKVFCDEIEYDYSDKEDIWKSTALDEKTFQKKLDSINRKKFKNYKAFIQGVFVTAWARQRIWHAIIDGKLDEQVVYSDTDSLKMYNYTGTYFEDQNRVVLTRLEEIARDLKIDVSDLSPVDIKGIVHPLGVWEEEKTAVLFRSLGCKQYIVQYADGKKHLTCAGVSKLAVKLFDNIDDFDIDRTLTEKELVNCTDGEGHTAEKLTPYYDVEYPDVVYPDGYVCRYRSGVCLMPTTFSLSITENDLKLLYSVVTEKLNEVYYRKKVSL